MTDYIAAVIYGGDLIGTPSGPAPLGHAGFIAVDGVSGAATYYDYGRYDGTQGIVRTTSLGILNVQNTATLYT